MIGVLIEIKKGLRSQQALLAFVVGRLCVGAQLKNAQRGDAGHSVLKKPARYSAASATRRARTAAGSELGSDVFTDFHLQHELLAAVAMREIDHEPGSEARFGDFIAGGIDAGHVVQAVQSILAMADR